MENYNNFFSQLIDKSKFEINNTTDFIEKKIKDTFDLIQSELIDKIKSDVQNELIKKLNNENIDNKDNFKYEIKPSDVINSVLCDLDLKKDEYFIFYREYDYRPQNISYKIIKKFIVYTNYNNVFANNNHNFLQNITSIKKFESNLKIPYSFLNFISLLLNEIYPKENMFFVHFDYLDPSPYFKRPPNENDPMISFAITQNKNCTYIINLFFKLAEHLAVMIKKYYADDKFGIYGNKFEEIVEEFSKTKTELEKLKNEFEILEKKNKELVENNIILQKELDDCSYLKKCLMILNNK